MKTILMLILTATTLGSLIRAADAPVAFQLYSGNESLPPQFQRIQIIRGRIGPKSIKVHYSFRDKDGLTEHDVELVDAKFRECLVMIQKTKLIKAEAKTGATSFDVTLTGDTGKSEMGDPSNKGDWAEFAEQIASAKAAAKVKK